MTTPEPVLLPELDTAPKSGQWVDSHAPLDEITALDVEQGERFGRLVDADNDRDTGLGILPRSQGSALARAQQLKTALLDWGVAQVSIELQAGRPITGIDPWNNPHFYCDMGHHTAIPQSYRDAGRLTPSLAVCKQGRSDVPGPLCSGYGGFDLVARILTLGPANHPGLGGPLTVAGKTIPQNNARPYAFGWEFEGGDYPWRDEQHVFMARCLGATQQFLGSPDIAHAEHKTWAPTRKIDRYQYTAESGIAAIRAVAQQEDDLPLSNEDISKIAWTVWSFIGHGTLSAHTLLSGAAVYSSIAAENTDVDEKALAEALAPLLRLQESADPSTPIGPGDVPVAGVEAKLDALLAAVRNLSMATPPAEG